jgi:N-acetylmuramoyl-L-alanine amidase
MWGEERRIKRRLLRELVDENVELKAGRRTRPRGSRGVRLRRSLKLLGLFGAPAALFVSSLVLSGAADLDRGRADLPATPPAAALGADRAPGSGGGEIRPAALPAAPRDEAPAPSLSAAGTGTLDGDVFPLAVRRIVLDPGHGGANTGTRTPGGLEEKVITLDIARRVRETLAGHPFEVLLTREGDQPVTLDERAAFANRERADIFVSIHVNWFEGVRESGIETYFLGVTDDPFLNRLAASENVESGHTLAEMRQLLEGIYAGVRRDKSENLAREIHGALFGSLRRVNPGLADRGVKRAPFLVLVDTEMPAVLAEVAALSSAAEAAMLEKPHYRDYIADSLAAGIAAYAESVGRPARPESFEARGSGGGVPLPPGEVVRAGDGGDPIGQKGR